MIINKKYPTILVVDDEPINLTLLNQILGKQYNLKFANNGRAD